VTRTVKGLLSESRIVKHLFPARPCLSGVRQSLFATPLRVLSPGLSGWLESVSCFKQGTPVLMFFTFLLGVVFFAPRISMGAVTPFYVLSIKPEDFLIAFMAIWYVASCAGSKKEEFSNAAEPFFIFFLLAGAASIVIGLLMNVIDKPLISFLYLAKWVEYYFVFSAAYWCADRFVSARRLLLVFFAAGIVVACYGYWEYFAPLDKALMPNFYRVYERPPFHGDANHIGGFLVLWIGFFTPFFLKAETRRSCCAWLAALLFAWLPLVWTFSRKSYFALGVVLIAALLISRKKRRLLVLGSLMLLMACLLTKFPERVAGLRATFASEDPFHSSWATNLTMWDFAFWNFERFFIFGSGLGVRHRLFYESQYVMILAETGVVGFGLFLLLILNPIRQAVESALRDSNPVAIGVLIGGGGVLVHSLSCVSLTVSKIAIPFWFLMGVALKQIGNRHD